MINLPALLLPTGNTGNSVRPVGNGNAKLSCLSAAMKEETEAEEESSPVSMNRHQILLFLLFHKLVDFGSHCIQSFRNGVLCFSTLIDVTI